MKKIIFLGEISAESIRDFASKIEDVPFDLIVDTPGGDVDCTSVFTTLVLNSECRAVYFTGECSSSGIMFLIDLIVANKIVSIGAKVWGVWHKIRFGQDVHPKRRAMTERGGALFYYEDLVSKVLSNKERHAFNRDMDVILSHDQISAIVDMLKIQKP